MKKFLVAMTIVALVAVLAVGCAEISAPATPPAPAATEEMANFRLLISDEPNAIGEFASLNVTVSRIDLQQGGESGGWVTYDLDPKETVDLTELTGDNATEIFNGYVEPGEYTKVLIHTENVTGTLLGDEKVTVKLPSEKLQISKPFTLGSDLLVDFIFDITVINAGKSDKYILKPQIAQSGPDQEFNEIAPKGKTERHEERHEEKHGKPEDELQLQLEGEAGLGATVTLIVTDNGSPVQGATVTVNGEEAEGKTDANGRITIELPATPGDVEIEATFEDKEGELELELEE